MTLDINNKKQYMYIGRETFFSEKKSNIDKEVRFTENWIRQSLICTCFIALYRVSHIDKSKYGTFFYYKNSGGKMPGTKNEAIRSSLKFIQSIWDTL